MLIGSSKDGVGKGEWLRALISEHHSYNTDLGALCGIPMC